MVDLSNSHIIRKCNMQSNKNLSQLKLFIVVNEAYIYPINARCGTYHSYTTHTRRYPHDISLVLECFLSQIRNIEIACANL